MMPVLDRQMLQRATTQPVNWRGRSGRFYALSPLRLESFSFKPETLYLIALGRHVLWVGTATDIVNDATSRARLRLALDCADRVFEVDASSDDVERMTIVWDLEGAEPLLGLSAA